MPQSPQVFRDFGIIPDTVTEPPHVVRAYFGWGHIIGQYIATGLICLFGLGFAVLFYFTSPFPVNIAVAPVGIGLAALMAFFVGRHDYVWVELDGETIRAKHLYTRRIREHSIREVDDLLTLVIQVNNLSVALTNAWLGRIRGVAIRFPGHQWPITVQRVDPKMTNAQQLIEALIYRMSQVGEVDAEVVQLNGSPMIRRIFWVTPPSPSRGLQSS